MPAENELLPCPFCGGKAIYHSSIESWVECADCGAQTGLDQGQIFCTEKWNRRANIKECARQQPTTAAETQCPMDQMDGVW